MDRLVYRELIEAAGFGLLIITGKNMRYQQTLTGHTIAFVVMVNSNGRRCATYAIM